jgi:hypothetical protein
MLFFFLAKQTLDFECHRFGDDFSDDIYDLRAVTRSLCKARFLSNRIARILAAAVNTR